jgi:hypothetical protein
MIEVSLALQSAVNFPTNLQNPLKPRKNYCKGFQKSAVTRDIQIECRFATVKRAGISKMFSVWRVWRQTGQRRHHARMRSGPIIGLLTPEHVLAPVSHQNLYQFVCQVVPVCILHDLLGTWADKNPNFIRYHTGYYVAVTYYTMRARKQCV